MLLFFFFIYSEDTKTEPTKSASSTEGTTEPIKFSTAVTDASDDKTGQSNEILKEICVFSVITTAN